LRISGSVGAITSLIDCAAAAPENSAKLTARDSTAARRDLIVTFKICPPKLIFPAVLRMDSVKWSSPLALVGVGIDRIERLLTRRFWREEVRAARPSLHGDFG
jgi:hypothetical protein